MLKNTDVEGRLRLFRYGLIVVVIVTFLISLLAPAFATRGATNLGLTPPPITDFLGTALLFTVVVAVIAVAAYFVYRSVITRS
jgi:hypothetical protein